MSDIQELVKSQFDRQAQKFSSWSVTRNVEYQKAYFEFCELSERDTLLDLACGTGEYALFAAPNIQYAQGIDLSKGMIELAVKNAKLKGIENVSFHCHPAQHTPFEDESFSIVMCRSAFHHFDRYTEIFDEMLRCCRQGGRVSLQDIVAYEDERINDYFEAFEKMIDISHHRTLTADYFKRLYEDKNIKIKNTFEIEIELNVQEYIGHANQSKENKAKLEALLIHGLNDPRIKRFFLKKDRTLFFKRNVFLILGVK